MSVSLLSCSLALDAYRPVPSRKNVEQELLEEEADSYEGRGVVEAIIAALDIQIDQ